MTQPYRPSLILFAAGALGAFGAVAFLLPQGEPVSHALLWAGALAGAAWAGAYAYARGAHTQADQDDSLRPGVAWIVLTDAEYLPQETLEGPEPLVALMREGDVPHPEFVPFLSGYFADPALGFVQTATLWGGDGFVAEAWRSLMSLNALWEQGRGAMGAATLKGSGALVSREALRAAWAPDLTLGEIGMRMQALGYSSQVEPEPLVMAWAPQTVEEYRLQLWPGARRAFSLAWAALRERHLPLGARMQYAAGAAAYLAAGVLATTLMLLPVALLLRGFGPVVVSSPGALPGFIFACACILVSCVALWRESGIAPARGAALAVAGVGLMYWRLAQAGWYHERTQAARRAAAQGVAYAARSVSAGVRQTAVIARGGGSAGTAPAGTPARL
jgi:hypothetical protein